MGEVSSDSKVKHIHKQTFSKRYFFDEKYSTKEKNNKGNTNKQQIQINNKYWLLFTGYLVICSRCVRFIVYIVCL